MMTKQTVYVIYMTLLMSICIINCRADYWTDRENFIEKETLRSLGSGIKLTTKEQHANTILMAAKYQEYDNGFKNPRQFSPARHFFHAKADIQQSKVFKIITNFPKGASLHSHDTSQASFDVLYNLTFWDNLYACTVDERLRLQFFKKDRVDSKCQWQLVQDLRTTNSSYETWMKNQLTLIVPNPDQVYTDMNQVWQEFGQRFITFTPLITYRPAFIEYYYQFLKELYADNVMYVEFRSTLPIVYDLDGESYGPVDVVRLYKNTTDRFKAEYPDFLGAKVIYAPSRDVNNNTMLDYIENLILLKSIFGDFVAGFDLVGQEDKGQPLISFVGELQAAKNDGSKLFFHAGETNWYGTSTDLNLVDAVLLGATRIGHGFGLLKHPKVLEFVKQRGIAIEVNPISNQVLLLVDDLRNHPGNFLFADNYPVIICNDDPALWGAKGLSFDWYEAFMGMTSREADLRVLKQLALNSLQYSALSYAEKNLALNAWNTKWNEFIDQFNNIAY